MTSPSHDPFLFPWSQRRGCSDTTEDRRLQRAPAGDLQEAVILLAFASMSVLITVVQEARTERVLEALRDVTSPRALVIRDGERKRIAGRNLSTNSGQLVQGQTKWESLP